MKKAILAIVIIYILSAITVYFINNSAPAFDTANYIIKWHTVEKGETLWELGTVYKAEGDDVRNWINAVKKLNGMSNANLIAGEIIKIYVVK